MKHYRLIIVIGVIEILIGGITLSSNLISALLAVNPKTANVFLFVLIASSISLAIGIGLLRLKKIAYYALIYFSSFVLLTKLMIFLNVIQLNGELQSVVPDVLRNWISVGYHGFILAHFTRPRIAATFH